jgi:hypothetical protein
MIKRHPDTSIECGKIRVAMSKMREIKSKKSPELKKARIIV